MLSSQIIVLTLTASALGGVVRRDFSTVYSDSSTLNTDAINLKNAVNSYDGSLLKGLALNNVGNKFQSDMKQTNTDCTNAAAFTIAQCSQEVNYLSNTYEPNLKAALAAIKSKKQTFTNAGFKSTIQSDLSGFKSASDGITSCIKSKCPAAEATVVQSLITKLDADFNDAISYYNS